MPLSHPSSRAFSLLEVMMGAIVLVFGFIGLIEGVTLSSEMLDSARKQQIAAQIIDGEFEALNSSSWTAITSLADGSTYNLAIDPTGTIASGDTVQFALDNNATLMAVAKGFSCTLTSSFLRPVGATAGNVTYLKVKCTVTWTGNTGRTHTRYDTAYFGLNGLHFSFRKS